MSVNPLRLYPLPSTELSPQTIYEDLEFPSAERHDPSRPYLLINMVSSLDGRTAINGKASRIGGEADRQVMRALRSKVDAVMIGANTLRAERLSLGLDEPAESQPVAVILTSTGDLPLEEHLIRHERQEVLVLVPEDLPGDAADLLRRHAVEVLPTPTTPRGGIDLAGALEALKVNHGVNLLLVEGGPTLNQALISGAHADELFLTLAPKLVGGPSQQPLLVHNSHPLQEDASNLTLRSVYLADNELFLRFALGQSKP